MRTFSIVSSIEFFKTCLHTCMKRDLYIWKETYIFAKRPSQMTLHHVHILQVQLYRVFRFFHIYAKRPIYLKRDLNIYKETCCIWIMHTFSKVSSIELLGLFSDIQVSFQRYRSVFRYVWRYGVMHTFSKVSSPPDPISHVWRGVWQISSVSVVLSKFFFKS